MSALKRLLKSTARGVLGSPLFKPLGHALRGPGSCLMYHRVASTRDFEASKGGFSPNRELAVSVDEFERQMEYVAAHCKPLSVPDAIAKLREGKLDPETVLVTFDDGYRDNLTQALPILRKHGVPATIYITTRMIGGGLLPWWYELEALVGGASRLSFQWNGQHHDFALGSSGEKTLAFNALISILKSLAPERQQELMELVRGQAPKPVAPRSLAEFLTWDEVRELAREPLITLGAHTVNHHVLSQLSEAELRREIEASRRKLEEEIGRSVDHFAYPFGGPGEAGPREFQAVESLGFASAFTTRIGHLKPTRKGLHALPRVVVGCHDTVTDLRWKLGGFDAALRRLISWPRGEAA